MIISLVIHELLKLSAISSAFSQNTPFLLRADSRELTAVVSS
jgi:hypothetical protein